MSFRKNLEYLRKSRNLSQEDLGYKLNVSRQSVSKWESGSAYPETDKMLAMCKLFDCTLDELMNQDIQEEKLEETRKYTFNDFIKSVTSIIDRSIKMICSMKLKSLIRFLFEIGILFLLILLLRIPFQYVYSSGVNIFIQVDNTFVDILLSFWKFLIDIVYLVVAVVSFVYIYKVRFLDAYDEIVGRDIYKKIKIEKEADLPTEEGKEKSEKKDVKVKYDFGIFSLLGRVIVFLFKCFIAFCSLFVVFFFLGSIAGLVIEISLIFQGIFLWSILLFLLSLGAFLGMSIVVLYNFIFDRRSAWKKVLIVLLVTLTGFGISFGIGLLELKEFTVVNGYQSNIALDTEVREFAMLDNLVIDPAYRIKYVEDSSLDDRVRIEVGYFKEFSEIRFNEFLSEDNNVIYVYVYSSGSRVSLKGIYNIFIHDLKRKEINTDYGYIFDGEITVYTTSENIEKLRENANRRYEPVYLPGEEIDNTL